MTSIISRIEQLAGEQPDATALIHRGGRLSYGELWRDTRAAAACLHERGVRAGDTVALSLDERADSWLPALIMLYALGYLGAAVLPLHPEAPLASRLQLVARFNARWLIASDTAAGAAGAARIDPGTLDWSGVRAGGAGAPRGDRAELPFLYMFTSGTTGDPKICLFPFGQLTAHRLQYSAGIGTRARDCLAAALPWPTKVGLRFMLRMHAIGGAFCNEPFPENLHELGALVRDFGLTQLSCSPWQLRRLLQTGAPLDPRLPALRVLQVGGGPVSAQDIQAARARITPNVYAVYAATELGVLAHLPPGELPAAPGHVGRLLPAVQGQAVDAAHRPLPRGSAGMLRFRTPSMPHSYADNPQASAQSFRDGWFYPGDLGAIDGDGSVTVRGRADEVINFGGTKIAPEATETLLAQHPDISDVAVVGVPHPLAGEYPVAFAVFRRMPDAHSLRSFCAGRMDSARIPQEFVRVDRIPRTREGKIRRGQLLEAYFAARRAPPPS